MGNHRTVVSDEAWAWMQPLLPSSAGRRGGRWRGHRPGIEAAAGEGTDGSAGRAARAAAVLGWRPGGARAGSPPGDRGDRLEVPDRLTVAGAAGGTVRAVADRLRTAGPLEGRRHPGHAAGPRSAG